MASKFFKSIKRNPTYQHYMLMKNVTPHQLSLLLAVALAVIAFVGSVGVCFLPYDYRFFPAFIMAFICGLSAYFLFYMALERFIYRKIKLIYKHIHRLKRPRKEEPEKMAMDENIIDNVESEVMEWTAEKKEEIDHLKKLEAYRREFMGNVSHELNTPIFVVQGYLHTLIDGGLHDDAINMKYLKKAAKHVERLQTIVEDLRIISQHESGVLNLEKEAFNIYDLAAEAMDGMEMLAKSNKITLKFKKGCERNMKVFADREKIRQVLDNLLSNSLKYGNRKGTTWMGIYNMDKYVLVEVTDNGIGIAEKHLPRLFERFYRVDTARSREKGGSGLGLAIAKHIVEAHGQTIHARSKEKIGTTFGFTLAKNTEM